MYKKVNEVAKELGVLRQYIYYHIHMGHIKAIKKKEIKEVAYIDPTDKETIKALNKIKKDGKKITGKNNK